MVNPNEAELTTEDTIKKAEPLKATGNLFNHEEHKFSRMGNGFAGDFHCRYYSCSFGKFMFHMCSAWTTRQDKLIRFPRGSGCLKKFAPLKADTAYAHKLLDHFKQ